MNPDRLSQRFCLRYSFMLDDMRVMLPSEIEDVDEAKKYYYVLAPGGLQKRLSIDIWIARIKDWEGQQEVHRLSYSKLPSSTFTDVLNGNLIDYWDMSSNGLGSKKISIYTQGRLFESSQGLPCRIGINKKRILQLFTGSEPYIEAKGNLKVEAKSITDRNKSKEKQAKKIFEWIVQNIKYNNSQQFLGAKSTLEELEGNCGGISLLYVALCRSVGIPSRIVSGAWVIPKHVGPHMWSEYYSCKSGWIPVDCSRAILLATSQKYRQKSQLLKLPDKPSFYFGRIENKRVIFSKGSNIRLVPFRCFPAVYPYMRNSRTLFMQPSSVYPYVSGPFKGYYVYRILNKMRCCNTANLTK